MDGVLEEIRRLKITNLWRDARNREAWRKTLREALAQPELLNHI
jgi:hypothetical protein